MLSNNTILNNEVYHRNGVCVIRPPEINDPTRGEEVKPAQFEDMMTSVINICESLDNGTGKGSLIAWVNGYIQNGKDIPATSVRDVIRDIFRSMSALHMKMVIWDKEKK